MSEMESATRTALDRVVEGLAGLRDQLAVLASGLPVSEREDVMYAGEEEFDFPTEVRSVIECVLADWIGPAIRDLKEAAAYGISESHAGN